MGWILYDKNFRHERVKLKSLLELNEIFFQHWFINMLKILLLFQLKEISYDSAELDCHRF